MKSTLPEFPPERPAPDPHFPPGRRRLKDLPPDIRRPLESQLASLRRNQPLITENEISHRIDLHPADIEALARTYGQP